ncbi:MAG: oligopeptidase A, partial [Sinobacterium sp.]|nr:oligopeptidase A [Sinobacterium sp.]
MTQPALNLPDFNRIDIQALSTQLDALLNSSREQLSELKSIASPTWQNFASPMQAIDMAIEDFWAPVSHLNGVKNSDELRDVYQTCIAKLTAWGSEQGQDKDLFAQYKLLQQSPEFESYDDAQSMWVSKALRSFTLAGVDLST